MTGPVLAVGMSTSLFGQLASKLHYLFITHIALAVGNGFKKIGVYRTSLSLLFLLLSSNTFQKLIALGSFGNEQLYLY